MLIILVSLANKKLEINVTLLKGSQKRGKAEECSNVSCVCFHGQLGIEHSCLMGKAEGNGTLWVVFVSWKSDAEWVWREKRESLKTL